MKRIIVVVPPGTEVSYVESRFVDKPVAIDRDLLDQEFKVYNSGVIGEWIGLPVRRADLFDMGPTS